MILHIPHSGTVVPDALIRESFLTSEELHHEMELMTDHHCDKLFVFPCAKRIIVPWTRLFCDVERFEDDALEPMSAYGQGMYYTKTQDGRPLRMDTPGGRQCAARAYRLHHAALSAAVNDALRQKGCALLVDCHSFSENALSVPIGSKVLPDVCIGTDAFHTDRRHAEALELLLRQEGYTVAWNYPFSGSLVPMEHYRRNANVRSIMIELNRKLYLNGDSAEQSIGFAETARLCRKMLDLIAAMESAADASCL